MPQPPDERASEPLLRPVRPLEYHTPSPSREDRNLGRHLYLPAALLLASWGMGFGLLLHTTRWSAVYALIIVTAYILVKFLVMGVTLPVLMRWGAVTLEAVAPTVVKLAAIAVVPDVAVFALAALFGAGEDGIVLLIATVLPLAAWLMFLKLFELTVRHATICAASYCGITFWFGCMWCGLFELLTDVAFQLTF